MIEIKGSRRESYLKRCRLLVLLCGLTAAFYLWWLMVDARPSNPVLFRVLLGAELFNIAQAAGFWYTIWIQRWTDPSHSDFSRSAETVDVFVTVCGDPATVVESTVRAVSAMRHPRLKIWILDDGPSREIEAIAAWHGATYVTRADRSGAKAGNINNALRLARGDYVVIFVRRLSSPPSLSADLHVLR